MKYNNYWYIFNKVGNEVGENFGWIGHPDCSERCPTSCGYNSWKYWKGITGGNGVWDNDESLRIEGGWSFEWLKWVRNQNKK